ncbi:PREDICTED: uncharacterized protein LOC104721965 isoform X3 [Camelina sativa]|uniref:Uncharacterized protein LOC104721965 isoform X3 n=1 Tax=Camelina sativa TaxID=90675 RepID=A0ABM0UAL2_CAMSA|nr:PREDICTED: uncharacterized protein LOC104721965 isoform X3 [Camelina sativa]
MKAKKNLFDGYIKMWTDEKTIKMATKNSKCRGSIRGGLGVAKHNNGAITYERRWDKMTIELGSPPNMIYFMEQTHLDKKTRTISDMKTKQILEMATSEMEIVQSQRHSQAEDDDSVQSIPLTHDEINSIMRKVVPKVRGKRYGFGNLFDEDSSEASPRQIPKLQEEIKTLKARELEKDAQIKYLIECNKLLLSKFPDLQPPNHPVTTTVEDDDETQP